ncbi:hypothetical protein ANN_19608 [Periplaneta americana]|uniref:Uncharacterized protein n=1 Tax=Periplaneta americana TaxID=6978 RepID=A0ABQ8SB02_PERAM|nr:hypothetical protein ANN_19608 [Periplaneta americana]
MWPEEINQENVLLFVTDTAPYVKQAGRTLIPIDTSCDLHSPRIPQGVRRGVGFSVDEIGDSEIVFGEMRPRIRHRLPGIHLTVGEILGKNPTRCGLLNGCQTQGYPGEHCRDTQVEQDEKEDPRLRLKDVENDLRKIGVRKGMLKESEIELAFERKKEQKRERERERERENKSLKREREDKHAREGERD